MSRRIEWPTWGVILSVYGGWLAATWAHSLVPGPLLALLGGLVVAWHGSLQHEAVHGHPTGRRRLDALIAGAPLGLWLPFPLYRLSHLAHHRTARLTDPLDDPESFYVTAEGWAAMHPLRRALHRALSTLVGRIVLGPAWIIARFLRSELRALARGEHVGVWAVHAAVCTLVLTWVVFVCGMSLATYLACFVYPGLSLTLLRSFAEHRPAPAADRRSAIVEAGSLLSLLFLNNNLHFVHHAAPSLPWYRLPERYRAHRTAVLDRNGGYLFAGYWNIARAYALRSKGSPVHPGADNAPARMSSSTRTQSSPIARSSVVTGTASRTVS